MTSCAKSAPHPASARPRLSFLSACEQGSLEHVPHCQLENHTDLLGRGERERGSAPSDLSWTLQPGTRLQNKNEN